jgi:hypothetical protein
MSGRTELPFRKTTITYFDNLTESSLQLSPGEIGVLELRCRDVVLAEKLHEQNVLLGDDRLGTLDAGRPQPLQVVQFLLTPRADDFSRVLRESERPGRTSINNLDAPSAGQMHIQLGTAFLRCLSKAFFQP